MQETETKRINDYEKQKHKELIDLEHLSQDLCQEHSKLMHQIEHINWHLGNVHPHDVATPIELPSHQHSSSSMAVATFGHGHNSLQCNNKSSANLVSSTERKCVQNKTKIENFAHQFYQGLFVSLLQGYLQISAERYVKSIAELRHKICLSKHNLEVEIERKRMAEKNLGDLRREVSKQKKLIAMRRCVPLPSISTGKKCVK